MRRLIACVAAGLLAVAGTQSAFAAGDCNNDYPTSARADYIFACMKVNGDSRDSLQRCSCSVDVIATLLPYDKYVSGETVASMDQGAGQIGTLFRSSTLAKQQLIDLRRAQAEAEIRCF